MSQLGATVLHKTLVKLFVDRGVKIEQTYQLNVGGDMDFYNMLDEERLRDKRVQDQGGRSDGAIRHSNVNRSVRLCGGMTK